MVIGRPADCSKVSGAQVMGKFCIWDTLDGDHSSCFMSSQVTSVAFDPWHCDGNVYRFGSVGEDCKLILWDFSFSALHRPKHVSGSSRMLTYCTHELVLENAHFIPTTEPKGSTSVTTCATTTFRNSKIKNIEQVSTSFFT